MSSLSTALNHETHILNSMGHFQKVAHTLAQIMMDIIEQSHKVSYRKMSRKRVCYQLLRNTD
jgi:hypothetical protein